MVLPSALPMTPEIARRWTAAGVPRWVPKVLLTTLWALAFAAAVIGDTSQCTPVDPAVCGPDQGFAWWIVVCLATPVLLVWMPLAGCAAGVAFAVADLAYDDVLLANIGFGLHGLACAVVAVWLVRAAAAQERTAATAAGALTAAAPPLPPDEDPGGGWDLLRLGAASLLVIGAVGLFGWYTHEVRGERAHLARAVEVPGRIVAVDDVDVTITLRAGIPGAAARRTEVGVLDTSPYEKGATTPVLLDPADPSWERLVAEPLDATGWVSAGAGALLLALLLFGQELRWRRARARLWTGAHPALRVRAVPDNDGAALVLPADGGGGVHGDRAIARLPVAWQLPAAGEDSLPIEPDDEEWDAATQASFGRAWRDEQDADGDEPFTVGPTEPEPAVLLGSLRDRGWALLVTADSVLEPAGPLRVGHVQAADAVSPGRRLLARLPVGPWRRQVEADAGLDDSDESLLPGHALSAAALRDEPELPLVARAPGSHRALGVLMVAAAFLGAPAALVFVAQDWYERGLAVFLGGNLLLAGAARVLQHVRLTRERLEVVGATRRHLVPWDRLHGARRDDRTLALAWEPDVVIEVGPFEPAGNRLGAEDRAEQLGAAMLVLRDRALAAGAPGRAVRSRPGPAWGLLLAYAAVVAAAVWFTALR